MNSTPSAVQSVIEQQKKLRDHIKRLCSIVEAKITEDRIADKLQSQICQIIDTLSADFSKLMELKRNDEFFEAILEKSPESQSRVDEIRKQYDQMTSELPAIRDELVDERHALKTRKHLHRWLVHLSNLDHRECQLLQKVWTVDCGSMD